MQRVSSLLPSWDRPKPPSNTSKAPAPLEKVWGWAGKIAPKHLSTSSVSAPARYGREHYWPTNLDRECEKAARILQSFCSDGYLVQDDKGSAPTSPTQSTFPNTPKQSVKNIPPKIIQNAVGLAIFSCMRSGLWMSGSGGSGILIARKADGTWSPPSGFLLHTAALAFVIGVDIYDCVLVINSVAALELFTRPRVTLGADVNLTVGPLATAGLLDTELRWKELEKTVLTYLKAKGQHRTVNIDGSLVTERGNENERFYGANVAVLDILAGNVRKDIPEIRPLYEVIKAAEGRTDFDAALLQQLALQPAPGDATIETPTLTPATPATPAFGLPNADDPDPFGVIALEMAGLEIREAGTRHRPTSNQFEYNPAPTSPMFNKFNRESVDTAFSRSNRGSYMSTKTVASRMTDAGTQTDVADTPETNVSPGSSDDGKELSLAEKLPIVNEPEEIDYTKIDMSAIRHLSQESVPDIVEPSIDSVTSPKEKPKEAPKAKEIVAPQESKKADEAADESSTFSDDECDEDADDEDEDDNDDEEAVIFEVATASQPQRAAILSSQVTQVIQVKGALVNIPKRIPPPLPPRSPARTSRASKSEFGDVSSLRSPLRNSFQSSLKTDEDAASVKEEAIQTSPLDEAVAQLEKVDRLEVKGHQRNSSSVYTTVVENRLSIDSVPRTPSTFQTHDRTSSGEEDHEPRTPKVEDDDAHSLYDEKKETKDGLKIEPSQDVPPIPVS